MCSTPGAPARREARTHKKKRAKSVEERKKKKSLPFLSSLCSPLALVFLLARELLSPSTNARHAQFEVFYATLGREEEENGQKRVRSRFGKSGHTAISLNQQVSSFSFGRRPLLRLNAYHPATEKKENTNALPAWLHAEAPLPDQGHGDRRLPECCSVEAVPKGGLGTGIESLFFLVAHRLNDSRRCFSSTCFFFLAPRLVFY